VVNLAAVAMMRKYQIPHTARNLSPDNP